VTHYLSFAIYGAADFGRALQPACSGSLAFPGWSMSEGLLTEWQRLNASETIPG